MSHITGASWPKSMMSHYLQICDDARWVFTFIALQRARKQPVPVQEPSPRQRARHEDYPLTAPHFGPRTGAGRARGTGGYAEAGMRPLIAAAGTE